MMIHDPRILCVDADTAVLSWINLALRRGGIKAEVVTTGSGREAFNLLNQRRFDVCVLEYALPDMTGVQLCSLMRHKGSNVPMVFFTAMSRPVDREKAMSAGAAEYLCK